MFTKMAACQRNSNQMTVDLANTDGNLFELRISQEIKQGACDWCHNGLSQTL